MNALGTETVSPGTGAAADSPPALITSATAGVVVHRVGVMSPAAAPAVVGAAVARADELNSRDSGLGSVTVYREAFGDREALHWLVCARTLGRVQELRRLAFADGTGGPSRRPESDVGRVRELVLLPQFVGMYGTSTAKGADVADRPGISEFGSPSVVLPAEHQLDPRPEVVLDSRTAGAIILRSARLRYEFRGEGRLFAREVAAAINAKYRGEVVVFLFEEAFGCVDRIHWLIHLRSIDSYYALIDGHAWVGDADRDLYARERVPAVNGGGTWARLFVEGGISDLALAPVLGDRAPSHST